MRIHQTKKMLWALCAAMGLGACGSMDVPDLNNPSLESLRDSPTRTAVASAATGLLIGHRAIIATQNGYVSHLGTLGREAYVFDGADPRFITEMLESPALDPGSPAFGGNLWTAPYANIRNAHVTMDALAKVSGLTEAEKEAIRGFAKTMQALDFLVVINTRDTNGAPINVNLPIDQLAPIESKDAVMAHITKLLDEGKAHLDAGGAAFPFELSSGFAGFDTPAQFARFNRALRARVDMYRGRFAEALVALDQSFLDTDASLDLGAYHVYETGQGTLANGLFSPNIYAHPSIVTEADLKQDGTVDERVTRKIVKRDTERSVRGLKSDLGFRMYASQTAPVPIIRNEELILLRAEASIGVQNLDNAIRDINFIREESGGLRKRDDLDANNILDELLKQRRYSLLFEGHRWIDARRHGRLESLPKDLPSHFIHARFPIPSDETNARP